MTAILAFLRFRSESVWPCALLHASHNFFDQIILGPMTQGQNSVYFAGETGIFTALVLIAFVIFLAKLFHKTAETA